MKAPHKRGVDAVRYGLLNMSKNDKNVGADCLSHVFWGVLGDSCRNFINLLSPEAARERYMDPVSVWILGSGLGHMAEKMACNKPLMNVSVPRHWLGRGATAAAWHHSVGPIIKYQGGWKPPAGYPPYVTKKKSDYSHHLFVMPKNEVNGRVGQLHPVAPGVGQHMAEREKKAEIFR